LFIVVKGCGTDVVATLLLLPLLLQRALNNKLEVVFTGAFFTLLLLLHFQHGFVSTALSSAGQTRGGVGMLGGGLRDCHMIEPYRSLFGGCGSEFYHV
jgi:hypothetical protein